MTPRPPRYSAVARKAAGQRRIDLWISPHDYAAITQLTGPREVQAFIRSAIREKAASMGVIVPVIVKDGAL